MLKPALVGEKEAAGYIGLSVGWLRKTRMTGASRSNSNGPDFLKVANGRGVRYRIQDLDRWIEENIQEGTAS